MASPSPPPISGLNISHKKVADGVQETILALLIGLSTTGAYHPVIKKRRDILTRMLPIKNKARFG